MASSTPYPPIKYKGNNILERGSYTIDANMVLNNITEYDISKANINILRAIDVIDNKTYLDLMKADRMKRQKTIGLLIKEDHSIYKRMNRALVDYRLRFYQANNILAEDILSIKNDAIFVINKEAEITTFDKFVNFKLKNSYTSFYKILKKEFYYNIQEDSLDVKGINDKIVKQHDGGFNDVFKTIFFLIETNRLDDALDVLMYLFDDYVDININNTNLYREFNLKSLYNIRNSNIKICGNVVPRELYDYSNNVKYLMELQKIVVSLVL